MGPLEVAFVVQDAANLSQEEDDVAGFMEDIGLLTTVVDDDDEARDFIRDVGMAVISAGASAQKVRDDYDSNIPVMVLNPDVFVEMEMVEDRGQSQGTRNAQDIDIEDDGHPIIQATGLRDGRVDIFDRNVQINFGEPGPDADVIASVNGNRRQAAIFAYEFGADLVRDRNDRQSSVRAAKNRRLGFFLRENTFNDLRNDGEALFEAAITWTFSGRATVGTILR